MLEAKSSRVQGHSLRATGIGEWFAVQGPVIDVVAAQRRPCLAEMNADLMGPSSLQTALNQRVIAQFLHDANARDRALADVPPR